VTDGAADGVKPEAAEGEGEPEIALALGLDEAVRPAVVGVGPVGPQPAVKTTIDMVTARIRGCRAETNGRLETRSAGSIVVRVRPGDR